MSPGYRNKVGLNNYGVGWRAILPAAAGVLAFGLTACERGPAADRAGDDSGGVEVIRAAADAGESGTALSPPVDDKTLAVKVRAALMASPALNATTIEVAASRGVVTLFGTTNTAMRRDLAAYIALRVEGVNSVRNRIVVIRSS